VVVDIDCGDFLNQILDHISEDTTTLCSEKNE